MTNLKKRERAKTNASLISMVQRFSDITIMFAGLWLVCEVSGLSFLYMHLLVALITLVVFQMLGGITDFYRSWRGVRASTEFALLLQNWTLSVIFSAGLVAFNNDFDTQLKIWLAWYGLTSIGLVVCRSCIRIGAGWLRNHGYNKRMVAVAGDLAAGQMLMESFRNQPWLGFEVVGVYHDPKPGGVSNDWAGNLQQLVEDAKAGKIHNVYIAMQMCDGARVKKLVHQLADTTCSVLLIPDVFTFNILHSRLEEMNGVPVVPLYDTPLSGVNRLIKRAEDIVLATLILLLISPVLCCIALAVKLSSPGPVIFRQTRYGMDGKPIKVWKFRSHQLNDCRSRIKLIKSNCKYFMSNIKNNSLKTIDFNNNIENCNWVFFVRTKQQRKLLAYLKEKKIMASKLHYLNNRYSCFRSDNTVKTPNADLLQNEIVALPCGWWLSERERNYIVDTLNSFC